MWENKKIVVIGVGGIGGYFGGLFARKGLNITFIARNRTLNALKNNGLIVESVNGNFTINPVNVTDNPVTIGPVDLILVCVKSYQVKDIIELIKPLIGSKTTILPLQNGVDTPSQLANVFGNNIVIGGCCKILSEQVSPGVIKHSGVSIIEFGEIDKPVSERVKEIKEILEYVGITAIAYDDYRVALWSKMALVCPLSGLTSITRSSVGEIRAIPETKNMLKRSVIEVTNVAQQLGIKLSENLVENIMQGIERLPPGTTTSMQRDILNEKPSELDFQVGAVVRIASDMGIEVPINKFLYYCLLPLEKKVRNSN